MRTDAVHWQTSVRATAVHALQSMYDGLRLNDHALEESLRPILVQLKTKFEVAPKNWCSLIVHAMSGSFSDELLSQTERAVLQVHPDLAEQLRLRVRPIREQWETYGPGLLASIANYIGAPNQQNEPTVVLVHPVLGGAATAYPEQNLIVMEAVLANSYRELPEVLRLGWCLSQLISNAASPLSGHSRLHALATIPPCLVAGESFDLCRFDRSTLELASKIWPIANSHPVAADLIWDWWELTGPNSEWPQRLTALTQHLK